MSQIIPQAPPSIRKTYNTSVAKDVHKRSQVSLLGSERTEPLSYRGLFNLVVIIAVATNIRLIFENFLKYGFLVGGWVRPLLFETIFVTSLEQVFLRLHVIVSSGVVMPCSG